VHRHVLEGGLDRQRGIGLRYDVGRVQTRKDVVFFLEKASALRRLDLGLQLRSEKPALLRHLLVRNDVELFWLLELLRLLFLCLSEDWRAELHLLPQLAGLRGVAFDLGVFLLG